MTKQSFALLAAALVVSGCTLGPDPQRPITAADGVEAFVHAEDEVEELPDGTAEVGAWWTSFGDPATSALVEQALAANTDLQAAAARVLESRALQRQAHSTKWPELTAGASAARNKNSFVLPQAGRVETLSTTYSTSLSVSYQVDLFGRLSRTRQAAWAELLATEAAALTVQHAVIAETVRGRVRLATATEALGVARDIEDSWARTLRSVERRYDSGLLTALEVRLARENQASAQATVVQTEIQLEQTRLALDVLVGRRPGSGFQSDGFRIGSSMPALADLEPVPPGLPADLLDRRPDLRQAELQLAAATARIGVALADLYPGLSLTGSAGTTSDTLSDLLSSDAFVYNAIANLLAPLWDGGRRRAQVEAARARQDQAAALYAGAVLGALREVEDALVRSAADRQLLELTATRVEQAQAADRIARDRYQRGVGSLLEVLETERRRRLAERAQVDVRAASWNNRIDLYLALGGDWSQPDEDAPSTSVASESTQSR